ARYAGHAIGGRDRGRAPGPTDGGRAADRERGNGSMTDPEPIVSDALRHQEAIRARMFHPSGAFVPVPRKELEQSIRARFEQQVRRGPDRIAVKAETCSLSYEALNLLANRIAWTLLHQ